MTDTPLPEPDRGVRVRVLQVSAIVEQLDDRGNAVLRRAVRRSARSRRPDGSTAVSLARLAVLVAALEHAGYRVQLDDEGVRR